MKPNMTPADDARHSNTTEPSMAEILEVMTEANRLAREGGTPEERAAFARIKASLLARLDHSPEDA